MEPETRTSATREALERSREYPESATPHTGNWWYPQYDWSWLRKPHRIAPAGEQAGATVPSLTEGANSHTRSGSVLQTQHAVWRAAARNVRRTEGASPVPMDGGESLRYQGQGERQLRHDGRRLPAIQTIAASFRVTRHMPLKGHRHARHRSRSRSDRHHVGLLSAIPRS